VNAEATKSHRVINIHTTPCHRVDTVTIELEYKTSSWIINDFINITIEMSN